ncbi:MAG: hypothetical protein ACLR6O_04035 [Eubacterium sp.]
MRQTYENAARLTRATVVRNYLDKCLEIPFGIYTKNNINLEKSRKILDKDHYGLDKVR